MTALQVFCFVAWQLYVAPVFAGLFAGCWSFAGDLWEAFLQLSEEL